jgi:hypothetical protein
MQRSHSMMKVRLRAGQVDPKNLGFVKLSLGVLKVLVNSFFSTRGQGGPHTEVHNAIAPDGMIAT